MTADDLAKILDELGQRLGPTGQHVFELAVRQVYITSVVWAVLAGLGLIAVAIVVVIAARITRSRWAREVARYAEGKGRWSDIQSGPDFADFAFPWAIGAILVVPAVGVLGGILANSIIRLLNPEYAALSDLISKVVPR